VDWLLGGFFTHESSSQFFKDGAVGAVTGELEPGGYFYVESFPTSYREFAGFADATYHFTDAFSLQAGVRESRIKTVYNDFQTGPYLEPYGGPSARHNISDKSAFTYLLTPQYKFSPLLQVYARLASGYRPGGGNNPSTDPTDLFPLTYGPDKTYSYEVGMKGDFLDRKLSVDTSAFYIDWRDTQFQIQSLKSSYLGNAGSARSAGLELAMSVYPAQGLTVRGWTTWTDAQLTSSLPVNPNNYAVSGDRLPNVPRWAANLSIDQQFALSARLSSDVGAVLSYVGSREWVFTPTPARQILPAYTKLDLHAGLRLDDWSLTLFLNNVTDQRGQTAGGGNQFAPQQIFVIQPRTVGLNVVREL